MESDRNDALSPVNEQRRQQQLRMARLQRKQRRLHVNKGVRDKVNHELKNQGALGMSPKVRHDSVLQWSPSVRTPQETLKQPATFRLDDDCRAVESAVIALVERYTKGHQSKDILKLEALLTQLFYLKCVETDPAAKKKPTFEDWDPAIKTGACLLLEHSDRPDVQYLASYIVESK